MVAGSLEMLINLSDLWALDYREIKDVIP